MFLQGVLVVVVTRGVVFARHQHAHIRFVAILKSAADAVGVTPHNLGEVAAGFWRRGAGESFEIVPLVLLVPVVGGVGGVPGALLPPEDVLAVFGVGVDEPAILVALHEVPTCVGGQILVPGVRRKVVLFPYPVVRVQELLRQQRFVGEFHVVNGGNVAEVLSSVDRRMG